MTGVCGEKKKSRLEGLICKGAEEEQTQTGDTREDLLGGLSEDGICDAALVCGHGR